VALSLGTHLAVPDRADDKRVRAEGGRPDDKQAVRPRPRPRPRQQQRLGVGAAQIAVVPGLGQQRRRLWGEKPPPGADREGERGKGRGRMVF